jgi:hypothetical protein
MSFTLKGNFDSENSNISIALFDESNGVKIMSISDPYVNMIGVSIDSTLLMAERPHGYANAGIGLPVGSSIPGVVLHKDDVEFVFMLYYNNTTRKFSASYLKDGLEVPIGSVDSPFPDGVPEKIDVTGMEWYGTTYRNYCTVAQISVESGF